MLLSILLRMYYADHCLNMVFYDLDGGSGSGKKGLGYKVMPTFKSVKLIKFNISSPNARDLNVYVVYPWIFKIMLKV